MYPPSRSSNRGAISSNSTRMASLSPISWTTRRRAAIAGAIALFHFCHSSLLRHCFHSSLPRSALVAYCCASSSDFSDRRAMVMHFSTSGRTSLALCSVVTMRPFTLGMLLSKSGSVSRSVRKRLLAKFLNIALR